MDPQDIPNQTGVIPEETLEDTRVLSPGLWSNFMVTSEEEWATKGPGRSTAQLYKEGTRLLFTELLGQTGEIQTFISAEKGGQVQIIVYMEVTE